MTKRMMIIALAMFVLAALLPLGALAAGDVTDDIALNELTGTVTLISSHAAGEGVSSAQIRFTVEPTQEDAQVTFRFEKGLAAPIRRYTYHEDTHRLTLYLVGTDPLMTGGDTALILGTLVVTDSDGEAVPAQVTAEGEALQYVYGMDVRAQQLESGFAKLLNGATPASPARVQLETLVTAAEAIAADGYTAQSYQQLTEALTAAKALLADPEATDERLTGACDALEKAMAALEPASGETTPAGDETEPGSEAATPGMTEPVSETTAAADDGQTTPAADGETTDTGDHNAVILWIIVFAVSGLLAMTLILAMTRRWRGRHEW